MSGKVRRISGKCQKQIYANIKTLHFRDKRSWEPLLLLLLRVSEDIYVCRNIRIAKTTHLVCYIFSSSLTLDKYKKTNRVSQPASYISIQVSRIFCRFAYAAIISFNQVFTVCRVVCKCFCFFFFFGSACWIFICLLLARLCRYFSLWHTFQ